MALIRCSECGREVSSKATLCVHCGCPIEYVSKENVCIIHGREYDLTVFKERALANDASGLRPDSKNIFFDLSDYVDGLSIFGAAHLMQEIIQTGKVPETFDAEAHAIKFKEDDGLIHCPRCDSTNIVTGQRGYSMVWGMIGSNRTMNRCAKCGYKWEPKR